MELHQADKSRREEAVERDFSLHKAFVRKLAARTGAFIIVSTIAISAFLAAKHAGLFSPERVRLLVEQGNGWGPLALIALIALVSMSVTIPAAPLVLLAGALYGAKLGWAYSMLGLLLGASIAFAITRLFRSVILRILGREGAMLARFRERYAATAILATRVFPILSFEVVNYASGLTSIRYWMYLLVTLGISAPVFVLCSLGAAGLSATFTENTATSIIVTIFVVAGIFVIPIAIDHYNPFGWKEKLLKQERISTRTNKR